MPVTPETPPWEAILERGEGEQLVARSTRRPQDALVEPMPDGLHPELLEALAAHPGRPMSKPALAQRLRSSDTVLSHDALDVYVHRVRRRIDGSGAAIHTLRGLGYVLEPADEPPA